MNPVLKIEGLSLGYGSHMLFEGISTVACAGQLIALCGANGVGKSTLLRTIAGLEPLYRRDGKDGSEGSISLGGVQYVELNHKRIAEKIAYVPSLPARARNLSVEGMLATNCYFRTGFLGIVGKEDRNLIHEALKEVSLEGFENRDSFSLSDGEYQRVAIAGAIVKDGDVIVLDEPTAFLDAANKVMVSELLSDIAHRRGKAVLFSTHDISIAVESSDRMWLMGADGLFYDKTPSESVSSGVLNKIFKISDLRWDSSKNGFCKVRG